MLFTNHGNYCKPPSPPTTSSSSLLPLVLSAVCLLSMMATTTPTTPAHAQVCVDAASSVSYLKWNSSSLRCTADNVVYIQLSAMNKSWHADAPTGIDTVTFTARENIYEGTLFVVGTSDPCPECPPFRIIISNNTFRAQPGDIFGFMVFEKKMLPQGSTVSIDNNKFTLIPHAVVTFNGLGMRPDCVVSILSNTISIPLGGVLAFEPPFLNKYAAIHILDTTLQERSAIEIENNDVTISAVDAITNAPTDPLNISFVSITGPSWVIPATSRHTVTGNNVSVSWKPTDANKAVNIRLVHIFVAGVASLPGNTSIDSNRFLVGAPVVGASQLYSNMKDIYAVGIFANSVQMRRFSMNSNFISLRRFSVSGASGALSVSSALYLAEGSTVVITSNYFELSRNFNYVSSVLLVNLLVVSMYSSSQLVCDGNIFRVFIDAQSPAGTPGTPTTHTVLAISDYITAQTGSTISVSTNDIIVPTSGISHLLHTPSFYPTDSLLLVNNNIYKTGINVGFALTACCDGAGWVRNHSLVHIPIINNEGSSTLQINNNYFYALLKTNANVSLIFVGLYGGGLHVEVHGNSLFTIGSITNTILYDGTLSDESVNHTYSFRRNTVGITVFNQKVSNTDDKISSFTAFLIVMPSLTFYPSSLYGSVFEVIGNSHYALLEEAPDVQRINVGFVAILKPLYCNGSGGVDSAVVVISDNTIHYNTTSFHSSASIQLAGFLTIRASADFHTSYWILQNNTFSTTLKIAVTPASFTSLGLFSLTGVTTSFGAVFMVNKNNIFSVIEPPQEESAIPPMYVVLSTFVYLNSIRCNGSATSIQVSENRVFLVEVKSSQPATILPNVIGVLGDTVPKIVFSKNYISMEINALYFSLSENEMMACGYGTGGVATLDGELHCMGSGLETTTITALTLPGNPTFKSVYHSSMLPSPLPTYMSNTYNTAFSTPVMSDVDLSITCNTFVVSLTVPPTNPANVRFVQGGVGFKLNSADLMFFEIRGNFVASFMEKLDTQSISTLPFPSQIDWIITNNGFYTNASMGGKVKAVANPYPTGSSLKPIRTEVNYLCPLYETPTATLLTTLTKEVPGVRTTTVIPLPMTPTRTPRFNATPTNPVMMATATNPIVPSTPTKSLLPLPPSSTPTLPNTWTPQPPPGPVPAPQPSTPTLPRTTSQSMSRSLHRLCGGLPLVLVGSMKTGSFPSTQSSANGNGNVDQALPTPLPAPLPTSDTIWARRTCNATTSTFDCTYRRWSALVDPTQPVDALRDGTVPLYQDVSIAIAWGLIIAPSASIEAVGVPFARAGDDVRMGTALSVSHYKAVPVSAPQSVRNQLHAAYTGTNISTTTTSTSPTTTTTTVGALLSFRVLYTTRTVMYANITVELRVRASPTAASIFDLPSSSPPVDDIIVRLILLPPPVPVSRDTITNVVAASGGAALGGGALVAPGVALQQGVAFALLRMSGCTEPDYNVPEDEIESLPMIVHPLQFPLGTGYFKYYRGAALSNTIILPAAFALISRFPVVAATQLLNRKIGEDDSADHALVVVGWPSIGIIPYMAMVEGSMLSSITLLYGEGGNIIIGLLGLAVVAIISLTWLWGIYKMIPRAHIELHKTVFANRLEGGGRSKSVTLGFSIIRMWGPWYEWGPKVQATAAADKRKIAAHDLDDDDDDVEKLDVPLRSGQEQKEWRQGAEARTEVFREVERTSHFVGDRWVLWAEFGTYAAGLLVGLLEGLVVIDPTPCRIRAIVALLLTLLQAAMLLITTVPVDFICALITGLLSIVIAIAATAVTFAPDSAAAASVLDAAATAGVIIGIVGVISMASAFVRFVVSFTHRVYYRRHELEKMGVVIGPGNADHSEDDDDDDVDDEDMGLILPSDTDSNLSVEGGGHDGVAATTTHNSRVVPMQAEDIDQAPTRCVLRQTMNDEDDRELGLEDYYGPDLDGNVDRHDDDMAEGEEETIRTLVDPLPLPRTSSEEEYDGSNNYSSEYDDDEFEEKQLVVGEGDALLSPQDRRQGSGFYEDEEAYNDDDGDGGYVVDDEEERYVRQLTTKVDDHDSRHASFAAAASVLVADTTEVHPYDI